MSIFITGENLDAQAWYNSKHPIRLGQEQGLFVRSLVSLGLNPIFSRPSNEKFLECIGKSKLRLS